MFERFDIGELSTPIKDPETGYLKTDARITKVGVFVYRDPDGTERRELRHPDEVFKSDALGSFGLVPFTNDHPGEPLDSQNTGRFQVGTVSAPRKHEDDVHVVASVLITDASTIEAAEKGKRELSCGYKCDLEHRAGITKDIPGVPDGLRFDAIQRRIRGNHVALVDRGRAGGSVSLRFDHGEEITEPTSKRETKMENIRIDGVDYEVTPQVAQAFRASLGKKDQEILTERARANTAEAEAQTETARADSAEEKATKAEEKADAAVDPTKLQEAVRARVDLEVSARKVVGDKDSKGQAIKLDDKTDQEVRVLVVKHAYPDLSEAKLDDESHVKARFEIAVEDAAKTDDGKSKDKGHNKGLSRMRQAERRTDADADIVETARQKMITDNADAWKRSPRADKKAAAA